MHQWHQDHEVLSRGLDILMLNNLFKFADTLWLRLTGAAMGTPPPCMHATLHFVLHELELLTYFQSSIAFC
jgi:hypothetical protein